MQDAAVDQPRCQGAKQAGAAAVSWSSACMVPARHYRIHFCPEPVGVRRASGG